MNERIKELLNQAGWNGFEALDERNKKFAELIVKECMSIATGNGSELTAQDIAQHFGVEE